MGPPPDMQPVASPAASASLCDPLPPNDLEPLIEEHARRNDLTPDLLRAVIRKESSNRPCALSPKGAMGLMQLMPSTAAHLGLLNPFDPAENIRAGSEYLGLLLNRYGGDLALALSAYNAGPARVDAIKAIPRIAETQKYVADILASQ